MLALPSLGFSRSITAHNVSSCVACDWIEGSLFFGTQEEISKSDIVDILCEEQIYDSQDFAFEMINNIWGEFRSRHSSISRYTPFKIDKSSLSFSSTWSDYLGLSFNTALALSPLYPAWASSFGRDYTEQGRLFEKLTKEAMTHVFPGWKVELVGASPGKPAKIKDVVSMVSGLLRESKGDIEKWAESQAKEEGLDILCYREFPDSKAGYPTFLMQCASGNDWSRKLNKPELSVWAKLIQFATTPVKGFAMPFCLSESDFRRKNNRTSGILFDRYRLLSGDIEHDSWISSELRNEIICWMGARIRSLPTLS